MYAAVFWDIDGTLVDSEPLHREKIEVIAADPLQEGKPSAQGVTIQKSDWAELHGKGDNYIYDWIKRRAPDYPLTREQFMDSCAEYYAAHVDKINARDGAREAFNIFAGQGFYQAAVSSGVRSQVDANLKVADLSMLFSLAAGDTKKNKPDPEPYNTAFDKLLARVEAVSANLRDKSQCIVIEDSASGVESGKRAGMTTIYWKLNKDQADSAFADFTVTSADEFTALAKRLALPGYTPAAV